MLIFGARNEIVAVQLIVQADEEGITRLNVSLPELKTTGGGRIVYRAPAVDPTDSADRPIQIFVEHYMHVSVASHADWVFAPRSPAARRTGRGTTLATPGPRAEPRPTPGLMRTSPAGRPTAP